MKIPKANIQGERKLFIEHLYELRNRAFGCLAVFLAGSLVGYFFQNQILDFLVEPLDQPLYYTSPAGAFTFGLSLCFFFGFVVSLPFITYQIFCFVEPAMPLRARLSVTSFLISSSLLVAMGMLFAYFISLPTALYFLNTFSSGQVKSLISTNEYLSFIIRYLLGFGILFQLPLAVIVVNRITPLKLKQLINFERWIILISFIVGAIITPTPDWIDQAMLALPLIILYQISIVVVLLINKQRKSNGVT